MTTIELKMWDELKENNFLPSIGNHGMIFITPFNKSNMFSKFYPSIESAYHHYKEYFTK